MLVTRPVHLTISWSPTRTNCGASQYVIFSRFLSFPNFEDSYILLCILSLTQSVYPSLNIRGQDSHTKREIVRYTLISTLLVV